VTRRKKAVTRSLLRLFLSRQRPFSATPQVTSIRDKNGRIMVAILHSDNPEYPEKYASLAYRIG